MFERLEWAVGALLSTAYATRKAEFKTRLYGLLRSLRDMNYIEQPQVDKSIRLVRDLMKTNQEWDLMEETIEKINRTLGLIG